MFLNWLSGALVGAGGSDFIGQAWRRTLSAPTTSTSWCPAASSARGCRAARIGANYYTPEITNVKFLLKMPLTIHWSIPMKIHWTSDNSLDIPLKSELPFEHVTESPWENATENPGSVLRCWFLVCNILPLKDHAAPRYIFTRLARTARCLFPEEDRGCARLHACARRIKHRAIAAAHVVDYLIC